MIRRLPVWPTLIVALAVAAMIALGVWQLRRLHEKRALIATLEANLTRPPIAFPRFPDESLLFRRAAGFCLQPTGFEREAGRTRDGQVGWRVIARCRTGAEGPGMIVQLGVTTAIRGDPDWRGGRVTGTIARAPSHRSLLGALGRSGVTELMLVADVPPPGLQPNPAPDPAVIPDNHLAYAVQWFAFAGVAVLIYLLALRRRLR